MTPGGFALGAIGNVHRRRRIGRPCLTADGPAGDGCLLAQTGMTPTQSRRDTSPATIVSDRDSDRDRHAGRSACNSASPRPRVIDIPAANTARSRRGTRAARPIRRCLLTSARAHKIAIGDSDPINVRFSNRPFGVKRLQTIHQHSVDVAHGLVLLFGIGAKALPSWDSKTRRNNLWDGLAVSVTAGPSGHTISPHLSSREGHHSTARWNSSFLLLD